MKISYTPESIDDLKRLREFIEVKNPLSAQHVAVSILKGISQLKQFPYLGIEVQFAPNPEMVRDLIIGNYIVRYLVRPKRIDILRVWHHKENRL
ncbi:MAG: type II toxin-antitoxin system RelE/ParE family toxin [Methylococcales bacterium]|nr:type II toxin-antitoxin system RelE/ParE family toxin [Methylococcales bacterium]